MNFKNNAKIAKLLDAPDTLHKNRFFREYGFLFLCALIPALLMYLIYAARNLYPFGDGCVLVLDLNAQYVWFFEALRNAVKGDASLLYSFSRALGGEFMGMYAYYIASPLSYIVCFFPQDKMLEALLTMFLLKTAICGATFGFYMKKTLKSPKAFPIIVFSLCYALSSYAVVQQNNTMWIDALMWLPLLTLGLEELVKRGKFKMYTIFLALTLFSNYYIGYMICIYCFIYFFLYYLAHNEENRNNPLGEKLHFFKSLFRIAFFSMVALGIAAIIILSAYYSLNFGKTTFSDPKWKTELNFDILDLLYKFLPGSYDTVRPEGLPFVYCGLLTLLLLPAYFLSEKYPMRQKIVSGIFIFILVASFSLNIADLIWHGFQYPNWLNHRYSFLLTFYLCVLACRAFSEFKTVSLKGVVATGGLIALVVILLQKNDSEALIKAENSDFTAIWFSLIMIFAYLALLGLLRKTTDVQIVSVFLLATVCVEVFLSGLWNLNDLDDDVAFSKYSLYNNFLNGARPIVNTVQASDTSFYRMEKTFQRSINDNMALKIRGLSGSTSTLNEETIRFLNKMGYSSKSHWSKYNGGTPVNDSLLGLKYIVAESGSVYENYYEVYTIDSANGYTAYLNPYALSIAYGVSEDILDFPLGFKEILPEEETEEETEEDLVDPKNEEDAVAIGDAVEKLKNKLNELLGIEETLRNGEYVDEYYSPFIRMNAIITAMLGEEEMVEVFVPVIIERTYFQNAMLGGGGDGHAGYQKEDLSEEAVMTYKITMPETAELYFYLPCNYPRKFEMSLRNGVYGEGVSYGSFNGNDTACIASFGIQEEGAELYLDMTYQSDRFYVKSNHQSFYYIDWEVFGDVMERLGQDQLQITEYTESSFNGTFTASREHELVLTTLAYDKGWKVYVDGVQVETTKALGALISFYIDGEAGETHTVEIIYRPNTLYIGVAASLASAAFLILLIVFEKKMKKIPFLRAVIAVPGQVAAADELPVENTAEEPLAPADEQDKT